MVIWLIGLAGSGKSTVGRLLYSRWKARDPATVLVDGDEIRRIFRHDRNMEAYSLEGRRKNAERIAELCAWLDRQDINVVCCILSIFQETRDWNRATYSRYFEIYLTAPQNVLDQRRALYQQARTGELQYVVGVDIPFTPPRNPDMILDSGAGTAPEAMAASIFAAALERT